MASLQRNTKRNTFTLCISAAHYVKIVVKFMAVFNAIASEYDYLWNTTFSSSVNEHQDR